MFGKRKQQNPRHQWQEPTAAPTLAERETRGESERKETATSSGAQSEPASPATPAAAQPVAKPSQPAAVKPAQTGQVAKPAAKPDASKVPGRQPAAAHRADAARRGGFAKGGGTGADTETESEAGRRLIVGKDIELSGEIKSCDKLVVEGSVEAGLSDSNALEVTDSGIFKGTAVIDTADIAGRFEGDLTVRERLYVRATGQVQGKIRYKALEIEGGGRVGGTMVELSEDDINRLREDESALAARIDDSGTESPAESPAPEPAATTNGLSH